MRSKCRLIIKQKSPAKKVFWRRKGRQRRRDRFVLLIFCCICSEACIEK